MMSRLGAFTLLSALMLAAVGAQAFDKNRPEPLLHGRASLRDVELSQWQRDWFSSVEAKDCAAVEHHLAKGKEADKSAASGLEGVMLRDGICRERDSDMAAAIFRKAIGEGAIAAMIGLGWLEIDGGKDKALPWFQKAFLTWGPLPPWERDAEFLKSGLYFPLGLKAPEWVEDEYRRISDLAVQGADTLLAAAGDIESGRAFLADPQSACLWRLAAARGPSTAARMALADQLLEGRGVPRRPDLAAKWLYQAALEGNVKAMARLGELMIYGSEGLEANPRGAVILLTKAEAAGVDAHDAMRAARTKLGESRAEAARRVAADGPLPVPRLSKDARGKECW